MFFQESDSIASEEPDLLPVLELVDQQLRDVASSAPLRPADFACFLDVEENQVLSAFELLAARGVLRSEKVVECEGCQNLMPADAYYDAIDDEDDFECTACGRLFPIDSQPRVIYRMADQTVSRAKAQRASTNSAGEVIPVGAETTVTQKRNWPDPKQHTTAKAWTTQSGAFCLNTETERNDDGKVEFSMIDGKPTKQMQFMRVLCFMHPKAIVLAEVMQQVYPEEFASAGRKHEALKALLKKVRTLISDIRKKLTRAGINPAILPPVDMESSDVTEVALNVAHLHKLDDIGCDDLAGEIGN